MSSPSLTSAYSQPLHQALLSCNLNSLHILAHTHTLDVQVLVKTMYLLSEFSRQRRHITPLQGAVMTGNYRVCKRLITEGADFFSLSYSMSNPLNLALDSEKFQIAKLLITSGADVCSPQNGFYPMYFAIKPFTPEYIMETIINKGFSPNSIIESVHNSTSLHKAVVCNNIPVVKLLLKYKTDSNAVETQEGCTPMHLAVKHRLPHMVELLAEYGADLEIESKEGFTPLFYAIGNNDLDSLDILLRYGAKFDHLSSVKLIYPLNFSASLCHIEVTEVLLKLGADVGLCAPGTGDLPIHSAAMSQKSKICEENAQDLKTVVELLIENASKIDSPNKHDRTPMQVAIIEENFNIVDMLVREGATVNRALDHGTSFHFVARRGTRDLVTTFLDYGADYSMCDINKVTPYHIAALNPDITILPLFWRFNCPLDLPLRGENSRKPLFPSVVIELWENQKMFLSGVESNDVKVMNDAFAKGAEAKGCSTNLPHPLHFSASNGFTPVVQLLLEKGVAPNFVNSESETPLHLAAKEGHYEVCVSLLKYGAVYNSRSKEKKTPLNMGLENGHEKVVDLLHEIDRIFKSKKESKVIRKLNGRIDSEHLHLAFFNAVNRKGETLMEVALKRNLIKLANSIMTFRLNTNYL